ncbi:MAG: packaged DNA stabilization gp4 family protein [Candidatus Adiutricales bacterium]
MSQTAKDLIKGALRNLGRLAPGADPPAEEQVDAFEALKMMFRSWSADNIALFYSVTDTLAAGGGESYTIGDGGDVDTVRPAAIRHAWTSSNPDVRVIDEAHYRRLAVGGSGGPVAYIWYNPDYPLGILYPWPRTSDTVYLSSLRELLDPAAVTDDVEFPPEYDEAIKFNLALRMAPEYGVEPTALLIAMAVAALDRIKTRNFAAQIQAVRLSMPGMRAERYNIDQG